MPLRKDRRRHDVVGLVQSFLVRVARRFLMPAINKTPWAIRSRERASEFDRLRGVETSSIVSFAALYLPQDGVANPSDYEPTPIAVFDHILAKDRQRVEDREIFIDFGSGKGRALIAAAELGFPKVIGVEISNSLCEQAQRNIAAWSNRVAKTTDIRIVTTDAREFEFPNDPSLLFFYNPFGAETIAAVLERLRRSLLEWPRPCRILYVNPVADAVFRAQPWLSPCGRRYFYNGNRGTFLAYEFYVIEPDKLNQATTSE